MIKTYKIGVRDLVSFLYATGDLSSDNFQNVVALEGTQAHQHLQNKYEADDISEYAITHTHVKDDKEIIISGRIDGLIKRDNQTVLEEIKSSKKNIFDNHFFYNNEHLAQLKMYAYMYMSINNLFDITTHLTYIQVADYKTRTFDMYFSKEELSTFFFNSVNDYMQWLLMLEEHQLEKEHSIKTLEFPFPTYRKGQRDMMKYVYNTTKQKEILFAVAPTGIGKTMASLFSSIKALDDEKQKIFYLTAKNQGKQIAVEALTMLNQKGSKTKGIEITSKDTICFLEKRDCDPKKCLFAKGFFDRLTEAVQDIFSNEYIMTRKVIETYARNHQVCPFEFALYVSYFVDVIICDYNYVFDPRVHLIRYFDDDTYRPILLIDEAHNMINRSRDMYSASIKKSDLYKLRKSTSKIKPSLRGPIKRVIDWFDNYEVEMGDNMIAKNDHMDDSFSEKIIYLMKKIQNTLKENPDLPNKSEVMEGYLELLNYSVIMAYYDSAYKTNVIRDKDDMTLSLTCLDASKYIYQTLDKKVSSSVFFSATLTPITYYKSLISAANGYEMGINSPFDNNRLKVIINDKVNTRYKNRQATIEPIIETIKTVIETKKGNYIIFFPSYQYLNEVSAQLPKDLDADLIIQSRDMTLLSKDNALSALKKNSDKSQLGLFVLGGIFSEGIDYAGDMLNGVIIVGVGLPMLNHFNDQLKTYYEDTFKKGFDYAYTYPGMNKVIQAVGRVIRSQSDYGIAILIDDRFSTNKYQRLMPKNWQNKGYVNNDTDLKETLALFWSKYEKSHD